jgi:hypothetical protein
MRELAGAFGDYGTFLPFAVGYIKDQRAHPNRYAVQGILDQMRPLVHIGGGRPGT